MKNFDKDLETLKGHLKAIERILKPYILDEEAAKEWIKESRPKWNDKDMVDFAKIVRNDDYFIGEMMSVEYEHDENELFNKWKTNKLNDN